MKHFLNKINVIWGSKA